MVGMIVGRGLRLLSAFLLAGWFQGCQSAYPAPPSPLRPTTIGVIAGVKVAGDGWAVTLTDGSVFIESHRAGFALLGGGGPGDLLLGRSTDPAFSEALSPSGPGCWEGWPYPSDSRVVWDMGDSIEFSTGLLLPKAPGFSADRTPSPVDGRLAWTAVSSGSGGMHFCVNSQGQVVSASR